MQWRNYIIERCDPRNFTLSRIQAVETKSGSIEKPVWLGYYPHAGAALAGIVHHEAGEGCEAIEDLAAQINDLRAELTELGRSAAA